MYLRNHKGKLVYIDEKKFPSEKEFYIEIWRIRYNIDIAKKTDIDNIMKFISGEKISV